MAILQLAGGLGAALLGPAGLEAVDCLSDVVVGWDNANTCDQQFLLLGSEKPLEEILTPVII